MSIKYENPPLVEAVCDFRLTPDTPWDLAVPGLFYERVKDIFPQREQRFVHETELVQGPEGLQQQIRTTERFMLFTEDRKTLIQLGSRLLAVNVLRPYPTWHGFKSRIERAWETLRDILEVRGLQRIDLHYINRIELPVPEVELKEYFDFFPFVGPRLPQKMSSFIVGSEFLYEEGRDRCLVQLVPTQTTSGAKSAFILDINYYLAQPRAVEVTDVLDWVEKAHSRLEEVFEGCITDNLRKLFTEVK